MTTTTPGRDTTDAPDEQLTNGFNLAVVRGYLSSDPTQRDLPSGEVAHSYEVTVREPGQPTASVPVALIGGNPPKHLLAGDEVIVLGRVRRRFFRTAGATASRTEVVAERIVAARRAAAVARVVAEIDRRWTEHAGGEGRG